jgi:hypothetical protein
MRIASHLLRMPQRFGGFAVVVRRTRGGARSTLTRTARFSHAAKTRSAPRDLSHEKTWERGSE